VVRRWSFRFPQEKKEWRRAESWVAEYVFRADLEPGVWLAITLFDLDGK